MSVKSEEFEMFHTNFNQFDQNIIFNVLHESFPFKEMRDKKIFYDVNLIAGIDSISVPAHRLVLSTASTYFSAMFTGDMQEKDKKDIKIENINGKMLELLINYCYTGQIQITSENVVDLLASASLLNFEGIEDECRRFLEEQLNTMPELWLEIYRIADSYALNGLCDETIRMACECFRTIAKSEDFLNMKFNVLKRILCSNENVGVTEEEIFEATMKWVNFDEKREKCIPEILKLLRLTKIDVTYFVEHISPLCVSHDCLELLHNVLHWRILPESQRSGLLSPEQLADRTLPAKILAIGGTDKPHEMSVERYCFRLKNWTVTDKFEWPENKIGGKLLIIGDNVYSIGGWNTDTPRAFNQLQSVNLRTMEFSTLAPMDTGRAYHNAIAVDDTLYVVGGFNGSYLNSVQKYDLKTNKWSSCAQLNYPRASMGITVLGNYLYVIGGISSSNVMMSVEYSCLGAQWALYSNLNSAHINPGVGVLNNKIYVVGGENNGTYLQTVERQDPDIGKWTTIASIREPRSGISVAIYENQLIAIGGTYNGKFSNAVEKYDETKDEWITINSLQQPRSKCGIFVISGNELKK